MRCLLAAMFGTLFALVPVTALAQPATDAPAAAPIDPTALGVSLSRINRRLVADARAKSQGSAPLNLQFFVDVYGTAPALRFFSGQSLVYGAVPGGPPSHREMLDVVTPQLFRAPTVNFFGMASAAAKAGAKKVDEWQYRRELRLYQMMIEAGKNVPAPQPPK